MHNPYCLQWTENFPVAHLVCLILLGVSIFPHRQAGRKTYFLTRTDIRHERRKLTPEEVRLLLQAARKGPADHGMTGRDREMLYHLALETGLRWSELYSLKPTNFSFDTAPPTVKVEAAYSKHRREDILPLRPETAQKLREYLALKLPSTPAFPMWKDKGAKMIRKDLAAAGIAYQDESGRFADFHSLRHSYISNLARSGVHPKVAQSLARHSTIVQTMDRYTHMRLEDQSEALKHLPDLSSNHDAVIRCATGTGDLEPKNGQNSVSFCVSSKGGLIENNREELRTRASRTCQKHRSAKSAGSASNRRKAANSALQDEIEIGGPGGTRTHDNRFMRPVL